mmetsp:Transcript_41957/g.46869  ORF Transcript_41957/g.46869 Transcript_41957/m.46869 type:complete len:212 (-) Transcript_41957:343-978(-)
MFYISSSDDCFGVCVCAYFFFFLPNKEENPFFFFFFVVLVVAAAASASVDRVSAVTEAEVSLISCTCSFWSIWYFWRKSLARCSCVFCSAAAAAEARNSWVRRALVWSVAKKAEDAPASIDLLRFFFTFLSIPYFFRISLARFSSAFVKVPVRARCCCCCRAFSSSSSCFFAFVPAVSNAPPSIFIMTCSTSVYQHCSFSWVLNSCLKLST